MLQDKKILLGIGGGIAVYRVAELARLLIKAGAQVRCVMTASACEFVRPLSFEALTGEHVHTELFHLTPLAKQTERDQIALDQTERDQTERDQTEPDQSNSGQTEMGHIQLARWADAIIIAPATANILARLAHGIADDLLSTIMLVCDKPVLLAPAMNASMWQAEPTQRNLSTLQQRGMVTVGPEVGQLACGEQGTGRLSEPDTIFRALLPLITEQSLQGQRWVINAGPTQEAWDGVRILTNRASGQLGAMLAEQAANRGASVCLIAGLGSASTSRHIKRINITTAEQMLHACQHEASDADVFIGTAAVSDFRFNDTHKGKLKRGDSTTTITVELTANRDIIAHIASMKKRPRKVIAFAAESNNHITHAKIKLKRKHVDAIVANDIANIGSDLAGGWWITASNTQTITAPCKEAFAQDIITHITELT